MRTLSTLRRVKAALVGAWGSAVLAALMFCAYGTASTDALELHRFHAAAIVWAIVGAGAAGFLGGFVYAAVTRSLEAAKALPRLRPPE